MMSHIQMGFDAQKHDAKKEAMNYAEPTKVTTRCFVRVDQLDKTNNIG